MKTLDYDKFVELVKSHGYKVIPTRKHHQVVDSDGQFIQRFAIDHHKGSKPQVFGVYVKAVLEAIAQDKLKPRD